MPTKPPRKSPKPRKHKYQLMKILGQEGGRQIVVRGRVCEGNAHLMTWSLTRSGLKRGALDKLVVRHYFPEKESRGKATISKGRQEVGPQMGENKSDQRFIGCLGFDRIG